MSLLLEDLHKRYGATQAVAGVDLAVPEGGTLALLGPSGCGKSTLLRLIAGLERPDRGTVTFDGRDVTARQPQDRRFGVVFQDYALFPHLDVGGNVAFGLVEQRLPRAEREARVGELLALVGLGGYERRRVHQLSGGQQQRVALARAIAPGPEVLLLDEPLSNLDEALRNELKDEIVRLLAELRVEAVYVTHDQAEAFAVADVVAVMREGRIVQVGDREALLESPVDAWTARFLGHENVWEAAAAQRLAAALGPALPTAARPGPGYALLLRSDLLELTAPRGDALAEPRPQASTLRAAALDAPGPAARDRELGALAVEVVVRRAEREGLAWRLTLSVPEWGVDVAWRGHTRELVGGGSGGGRDGGSSGGSGHGAAPLTLPEPGTSYSLHGPSHAWQVIGGGATEAQPVTASAGTGDASTR